MILKASQRAGGADLASHLMNELDNHRIEVAQIRGSVADDLHGAFAEFEALASCCTKARKPFYSLSINPAQPIDRAQYFAAIDRIEERLGLSGQPRTVIFHVKDDGSSAGREHCHVVWSRTIVDEGRAVHLSHDHEKLCDLSVELAMAYGLPLAPGLEARRDQTERKNRKDKSYSASEKAQFEATGITRDQRATLISKIYERADGHAAFRSALEENGFLLAQGDQRGFVIVDSYGQVHSLSRQIKGTRAKDIAAKLDPLQPNDLPTVDQARAEMEQRSRASEERSREKVRAHSKEAFALLAEMQEKRRMPAEAQRQELEARHWQERLELSAQHKREGHSFWAGFSERALGLLDRVPALRSVVGHIRNNPLLNPAKRQELENQALANRHKREQKIHDRKLVSLDKVEAYERRLLLKKLTQRSRMSERQRDERALKRLAEFIEEAEEITRPQERDRKAEDEGKKTKKKAAHSAKREKKRKSWKDRKSDLDQRQGRKPDGPGKGKGWSR